MSFTQTYIGTLVVETCCNCGIVFGIDRDTYDRRSEDHKNFYCPAGHGQHYTGKTEADKLKEQIQQLETNLQYSRNRRDELHNQVQQLNYSVRAQKAAKTKIINRVKNGVCPCCNRTFHNLQNHFKTKHPELITGK